LFQSDTFAFSYNTKFFTPDELITIIKLDTEYANNRLVCKQNSLVKGVNKDECEKQAHSERNKAAMLISSIAKELETSPLLTEEKAIEICNKKPEIGNCSLDVLIDHFCKSNLRNVIRYNLMRGNTSNTEKCDISVVNYIIGQYREIVLSGKKRPNRTRFGWDPNPTGYTGPKATEIRKLYRDLKTANDRASKIDYIYWSGYVWVRSEWGDDGIRQNYPYLVSEGSQVCRLVDYKKDERGNSKVRKSHIYFNKDNNQDGTKIHGYNFDLNAIGGTVFDQYSSTAKVGNVLMSTIPHYYSIKDRKDLGCFVPSKDVKPEPKPEPPPSMPGMSVQIKIYPSTTSTHSGTVSITANGTPPWEVSYEVYAYRDEKWHYVGKEHIKFLDPRNQYNRDYYWHKAERWELRNVMK
jgi:hypothetical protein